ncbi:hypothetical protein H4582DRAFT_2035994, partial [Lactarius indigo]
MRRSYPAVVSSLDWTNVSQSAIVLRWQGADPKLKPVIITNDPEMLGPVLDPMQEPARAFQFGDGDGATQDMMDVHSAVGLLTAVDALVQSGYQPSRTLVFGVMLGEIAGKYLPRFVYLLGCRFTEVVSVSPRYVR